MNTIFKWEGDKLIIGRKKTYPSQEHLQMIRDDGYDKFLKKNFYSNYIKIKKVYHVVFLQETKYSLIYLADNKKKIKILKVYKGMEGTRFYKTVSYLKRCVITTVLLCLLVIFVSFCCRLVTEINKEKIQSNINVVLDEMNERLSTYGWQQGPSYKNDVMMQENSAWSRENPYTGEWETITFEPSINYVYARSGYVFFPFTEDKDELKKIQEEFGVIWDTMVAAGYYENDSEKQMAMDLFMKGIRSSSESKYDTWEKVSISRRDESVFTLIDFDDIYMDNIIFYASAEDNGLYVGFSMVDEKMLVEQAGIKRVVNEEIEE